jgi:hypothetical protein
MITISQEQVQKNSRKAIQESAWIQFLFTLKFWLDDELSF